MSELQISLLAIGFLIVVGVYGFNRFQERKYRKRAEQAFSAGREDVLLQEGEPGALPDAPEAAKFRKEPRIEPVVSAEEPALAEEMAPAETIPTPAPEEPVKAPAAHAESSPAAQLDELIDYVARIHPGEAVAAAKLLEAVQRRGGFSKPAHWLGLDPLTGSWEEIGLSGNDGYSEIAVALQLADRAGPVSEQDLAAFCNAVQEVAGTLVAVADFPERQPALARAAALDQFCADVDVLIGINVITRNGEAFPATKVRALAESAGMKLRPDGTFHFINDEGADLFSLGNLDPAPFSAENIRHLSTHGITFLFDVPRVADGVRAFGQMLTVARQMAASLGGQVVDDNRRPLSDAGIDKIRQQLGEIYGRMEAQQIESGSARALRLFS